MLIVANWKAYVESLDKARRLYAAGKRLAATGRHDIVLAPSFAHLGAFAPTNRSSVEFAAQDLSRTLGGAATGEVTAGTLADAGATYVIVGHSERRAMGETDAIVLEKVQHALAHGLTPILCVGERERDPDARYLANLKAELATVLAPLTAKERARVVIAYEPLWAIGKKAEDAISSTDLTEMVLYLRKLLGDYLPGRASLKMRILYGGSVEPGNIRSLASGTGIDGFLIGHATVDPQSFGALVKALG